jgi:GT2 family glycosyltransferase
MRAMTTTPRPHVSFVLATHNRRAVVTQTLTRILDCGLDRRAFEVIVVDNASSDGTTDAVGSLCDILIRLRHNAGSCAKADGVEHASGEYIIFLDDDSFPRHGTVARMIAHFEEDPRLGAAGFTVHLPDGRMEGGALPDVFVGCGVGFRVAGLRQVGGLDRSFFMQAEEYDLAFRLVNAGWGVRVYDDLQVDHLKTPHTRKSERTTFYDIRNNLRVAARYLPAPQYRLYRDDWLQRYAWLAERDGHIGSFVRGMLAGTSRGLWERFIYRNRRLSHDALEHFFRWDFVRQRMGELEDAGVGTIVLADLGKNVLAYYLAARDAGVKVMAIGDDRFCASGRHYRGIPVIPLTDALSLFPDAVVVGNMSGVHGTDTYNRLVALGCEPVYHWFGSVGQPADNHSTVQTTALKGTHNMTVADYAAVR